MSDPSDLLSTAMAAHGKATFCAVYLRPWCALAEGLVGGKGLAVVCQPDEADVSKAKWSRDQTLVPFFRGTIERIETQA